MTISYNSTVGEQVASGGTGTSASRTLSVSPTDGDVLIASLSLAGRITNLTAPDGWSQIGTTTSSGTGNGDTLISLWYKVWHTGDSLVCGNWTWTTSNPYILLIGAWSGVSTSPVQDVAATQASSAATTSASLSRTPVTNGAVLVGTIETVTNAPDTPANTNLRASGSGGAGRSNLVDETVNPAAATTITWSFSSSKYSAALGVLRPASPPPGPATRSFVVISA